MKTIKEIIHQTFKEKEEETYKWSAKRFTAFFSFLSALIYSFVLPFLSNHKGFEFQIHEYVFNGLLILTGTVLGLTVWNKKV